MLTMTITTPYLLIYKLATLKNTVTALLEYIDLLNRYSKGPSWGLLGPLSDWGPGQNAPVPPPPPPPWAALLRSIQVLLNQFTKSDIVSSSGSYPLILMHTGNGEYPPCVWV